MDATQAEFMHLSMLSPIPKYGQGGDDFVLTNTCNISWNPLISNSPPLGHGNGPPLGYILPASFLWYSIPPIPVLGGRDNIDYVDCFVA